jgi:photosynthetic reaction center cytochrome c subunit
MLFKRAPYFLGFVSLALLSMVCSGRGQPGIAAHLSAQIATPQMVSEPAGAGRCVFCHRAEVEGYARSAMAHSLRTAGQEPDGAVDTPDAKITMHSSPTGYWQRLQSGGDVSNYRIDYVIGSGNHASGYLVDLAGHLFQSPVAFYKTRNEYDLAPGYEGLPNPDFTRPVAEGCLFCHAGSASHIAGTANQYRTPPFSSEAITCERCHGSAERHLSDPRAGTIINPGKLAPAARDSICEQCHLLGVGRVLNPGKRFADFRPGQPLEDVFTTYINALPPGADAGKFKVISHVEQLARSRCARNSDGRLWCGTCHDPHNKPVEPVEFYRSKCLTCHTGNFANSHPAKDSDCISCHMPRRAAKDGGHTAFTDHRIQRRPDSQSPLDVPPTSDLAAWRQPAPDLQTRNLGIAYINAGAEHNSPPSIIRGYRMLTEVQNQFSTDSEVFTSLGTALLLGKQASEAELAFERALQLNPKSVAGETNAASAYLQAGNFDQAIAHLERAVALDPLHLPADAPLIALYKQQGSSTKAAALSAKVSAAMEGQSPEVPMGKTSSPQITETAFKNIQVLKGVPSGQLLPAMRFISASLGVECSYCHVEGHFDEDDKKPKQIARAMMRMMVAIDTNSFDGNREVTCYTCHQGSPKPVATPAVGESRTQPEFISVPEKLAASLPTADQLIDKYIEALGGTDAIEKITSREEKGETTVRGKSIGIEVLERDPNQLAEVRHTPAGDSTTVFDGQGGWFSTPGRSPRELQSADLDAAQMDADLHFALHIRRIFAELIVEYPDKIGDREVYVVSGTRAAQQPMKFYFDEESGLLLRLVRYAESPLGLLPTQIDYSDYREVDGVRTPFRWRIARPDGSSTIQLQQVRQNGPIDDSRFAKPTTAQTH